MDTVKIVLKAVSEYIKESKNHKARIIIACVCFLLLSVGSFLFAHESGFKNICVCICLSALIGLGVAFYKIELPKVLSVVFAVLTLVVYLIIVPKRLFIRTEYPIYDMTSLLSGAWELNILILLIFFFILLFIFQRVSISLGIEGVLVLLLTIINFYATKFRGSGLTASDIWAAKTASMVMKKYDFSITPELWKSVLYILLFTIIGCRIDVKIRGWKYHLAITLIAVTGCCVAALCYNHSDAWNDPAMKGDHGNIIAGEKAFGLYYYLVMTGSAESMEYPDGYSNKKLDKICETAEAEYTPTDGYVAPVSKPNLIFIMNEAWSDVGVLGNLETNKDYMPFWNEMTQRRNTVSGNVSVNILGGMTANSEFEALTGDSMAFLNSAAIPYTMHIKHPIFSLATVLGEHGYQTIAFHPYAGASWNRNVVYENMGFDRFITYFDMPEEREFVGGYVSDKCDYEEVIRLYENRDADKPFFLFNVTIQNHSPYGGQVDENIYTTRIGNSQNVDFSAVNQYLSLISLSDEAFKGLIDYFEKVDEPTVVCMFGDHQPILDDSFYDLIFEGSELSELERNNCQYKTQYLIWANYDADFPEYGDVCAAQLGAVLCEACGIDLPPYYKFILNARKEIATFNIFTDIVYEENDILDDYRCLQYNHLIVTDSRKDIFSAGH